MVRKTEIPARTIQHGLLHDRNHRLGAQCEIFSPAPAVSPPLAKPPDVPQTFKTVPRARHRVSKRMKPVGGALKPQQLLIVVS